MRKPISAASVSPSITTTVTAAITTIVKEHTTLSPTVDVESSKKRAPIVCWQNLAYILSMIVQNEKG